MPAYRFYGVDVSGRRSPPVDEACLCDAEAEKVAQGLRTVSQGVEVWENVRLVSLLPAAQAAEVPDDRAPSFHHPVPTR